jgi:hypothetical protein
MNSEPSAATESQAQLHVGVKGIHLRGIGHREGRGHAPAAKAGRSRSVESLAK